MIRHRDRHMLILYCISNSLIYNSVCYLDVLATKYVDTNKERTSIIDIPYRFDSRYYGCLIHYEIKCPWLFY